MNIEPGTRLGRYEIRALIGAGGMGEVYRARDTALVRDVAVKILPANFASDIDRLRRFELEAHAAGALNHPNIVAVYDVGTENGAPYVVSELLEGETLRDRLLGSLLPIRKVIDYALQIARGLAAAHDKGIVHRDLKPENLFISKDGHVKILDFGLAKLNSPLIDFAEHEEVSTVQIHTRPGAMLGTVAYMSPEEIRLQPADARSDIFSFGAVLYEMISGNRPFKGDSPVETMNVILKEDPPIVSDTKRPIPPALDRIIRHCLEKKPDDRFQSMRDLIFDLEALSGISEMSSVGSSMAGLEAAGPRRIPWSLIAAAAVVLALVIGIILGRRSAQSELPRYRQVTFSRGTVWAARFASDAQTVVYSATWNGNPLNIFSTRPEGPESRSLDLENADLLAISPSGEMAILLNRHYIGHFLSRGTLARLSLAGGAPREVLENVQQADWSPDGKELAVVRYVDGKNRLEYPIGKVLYETTGYVSYPRVSPNGDFVAFLDHPSQWDDRGSVAFVDLGGNKKTLSHEWADEEGLAWSPDGKEIWFTASKTGEVSALHAVTLAGTERLIARVPANLMIHDISRDGVVLCSGFKYSTPVIALPPGETTERDLSWLDSVGIYDLSPDGKQFIFQYYGEGSGTNYSSYLRKTDGTAAKRLGDGAAIALSPDGKWVITVINVPRQTVLLPTGAGEIKRLDRIGILENGDDEWFPDGERIVFTGSEQGKAPRSYSQDIEGGRPQPLTPEGIRGTLVSPDGKFLLTNDAKGESSLFALAGGTSRQVRGLEKDDRVIRFGPDSRTLYVYQWGQLPQKIYRLDVDTGRKELLREIRPSDPAGIIAPPRVLLTLDGKSYVYQVQRTLSELYLVEGFQTKSFFQRIIN